MSSQDSVINSASVSLTNDVLRFLRTEKQKFIVSRVSTIVVSIAAGFLAYFLPSLIDTILICYSIWAPTVVVPLVAAIYM